MDTDGWTDRHCTTIRASLASASRANICSMEPAAAPSDFLLLGAVHKFALYFYHYYDYYYVT